MSNFEETTPPFDPLAEYPDLQSIFAELPDQENMDQWAYNVSEVYTAIDLADEGSALESAVYTRSEALINKLSDFADVSPEHAFAVTEALSRSPHDRNRSLAAVLLQPYGRVLGARLLPFWHGLLCDPFGDAVDFAHESLLACGDQFTYAQVADMIEDYYAERTVETPGPIYPRSLPGRTM